MPNITQPPGGMSGIQSSLFSGWDIRVALERSGVVISGKADPSGVGSGPSPERLPVSDTDHYPRSLGLAGLSSSALLWMQRPRGQGQGWGCWGWWVCKEAGHRLKASSLDVTVVPAVCQPLLLQPKT